MTIVVDSHHQHTAYLLEICIDRGIEKKHINALNEITLVTLSDNFEEDKTAIGDLEMEIDRILEVLKGESEYLLVTSIVNFYSPTKLLLKLVNGNIILSGTTTDHFGKKNKYNRRF